jgi:hypothetical protein
MVICAPCLLPVIFQGAVGLTGAIGYSNVRDKNLSKNTQKKKNINTQKKKKKTRKKKSIYQNGGRNRYVTASRRMSRSVKRRPKIHYGIKHNKVIRIYPHKIEKRIGGHNYYILWKTTKNNLPGKTFHGKFYKSKEEATKNLKKRK